MNKPCNKCENAYSYKTSKGNTRYYCGKPLIYGKYCEKYKKYKEYLESNRKYSKGKQVKSVQEYLELTAKGERLFYWGDIIRHIGWLESLQFRFLIRLINQGSIFSAIKKNNSNNTL